MNEKKEKVVVLLVTEEVLFNLLSIMWNALTDLFTSHGKCFVTIKEFLYNRSCYDWDLYRKMGIHLTDEEMQTYVLRQRDFTQCDFRPGAMNVLGHLADRGVLVVLLSMHDEDSFASVYASRGITKCFDSIIYGVRGTTEAMAQKIRRVRSHTSDYTYQVIVATHSFFEIRSAMEAGVQAALIENSRADVTRHKRYDYASRYQRISCISDLHSLVP